MSHIIMSDLVSALYLYQLRYYYIALVKFNHEGLQLHSKTEWYSQCFASTKAP